MKKKATIVAALLYTAGLMAQGEVAGEGGGFMRSNHKIFVAVSVLAIILTAVFLFLLLVERRLKRLEDKQSKLS
jgi:membrane protein DedA with SNARE-associated domain